jgi:uncharacterized membrane protein YsdA (DUF1294 family)/cold shock CspA family protein
MGKPIRLAGRISDWNDDKGYGFVVPNGGGDRAFVHVNEFQRGSRRPVDGDLISYLPSADARGRLQAREIRHAGQRIEPRHPPSRLPRAGLGIAALAAIIGLAAYRAIPMFLAGAYLAMSVVSYVMYLSDKMAAERNVRRTPENTLHLADLMGGWPGALVAQQQFRHKTIKQPFQFVFWVTVALNLAGAWWVLSAS